MAAAMQIFMAQEKGTSRPNKITPKQIKFEDEEDRISLLPDCLLIEILSRFDETKEAIKTSTLSKRWQHLWTQVPNLIFHQKYPHSTTKFFSIVDKTLTQCSRQSTLNRFVLDVEYDIQFEDQLNNWIHYAIHRNVQEMDLSFFSMAMARVPPFVLDQLIFTKSCFTRLNFRRCRLSPTSAVDWKNLKSLYISRVKLNEDLIQNILSGSPILEAFELCYCEGFRRLDITSKVVKNLVCHGYYRDPECIDPKNVIVINAPYITSLTIRGMLMLRNLVLLNLTSLIKANFNFWKRSDMESEEEEMLSRFVLNLRHVKELKIGDRCLEILSRLEAKGFTSPSNVNYL